MTNYKKVIDRPLLKVIDITGPEPPFFHKGKGILKIDQSVKMP